MAFAGRMVFCEEHQTIRNTAACKGFLLRLSLHMLRMGVVRSRWASWSSKPVAGRVAGRGGFDSHPLSPKFLSKTLKVSMVHGVALGWGDSAKHVLMHVRKPLGSHKGVS